MKPKRVIPILAIIAVAIAVWFWMNRENTDPDLLSVSGTIEATEARLGFQVPGRIESITADEGDVVESGTILARLETSETIERREQTLARLAAAQSLLDEMQHGARPQEIAQARASVAAAEEQLDDAKRDLARNRQLYEGGAISREMLDKSESAEAIAAEGLVRAQEQLSLVRSGTRPERVEAQEAQVAEAQAAVRAIEAALENYTIAAPFTGLVTVRHREPEEIVAPGQPVVTLMNPADRWVRIYVPENRIGGVHLGTAAEIRSDTYPDKSYRGRVVHIASQAEFTPKNVQTTEERVRLVYAVKVQIEGDDSMELKPGMPADVEVAFGVVGRETEE